MNETRANKEIRDALSERNICLWELAQMLNKSEATIVRMFRKELTDDKKTEILSIINKSEPKKKKYKWSYRRVWVLVPVDKAEQIEKSENMPLKKYLQTLIYKELGVEE